MQIRLKNCINRLAIPGYRNALGPHWNEVMNLMEQLILETGHQPQLQSWEGEGRVFKNFSIIIPGKKPDRIVIGAHYDSFDQTPGADDNASAVAVLLELARAIKAEDKLTYTLEMVFYACEEPPFFGTEQMGSAYHARKLKEDKTPVQLMICFEMLGFFSEEPNSQDFPFWPMRWFYSNRGNFYLLVGNWASRKPTRALFKGLKALKSTNIYKKLIPPLKLPGLDWSDHRNYWAEGFPALMLTDAAFFRNKNYHQASDLPPTLDYAKMERLTEDLLKVLLNISYPIQT